MLPSDGLRKVIMSNIARTLSSLAVGLSSLILLTACAGEPTGSTPTATVTVTAPAAAPTPSSLPTTSSSTPQPGSSPSGPAVISVQPGAERTLTKSDAFSAENWDEGSYQPVNQPQEMQALAAVAGCRYGAEELEFRFAQNAGSLTFQVAQDMSSKSSEEILEWALVVDGRQVETKKIAFKDSVELTTPLTGVAVVKLQVNNPEPCSSSAIGLVTKAVIQG